MDPQSQAKPPNAKLFWLIWLTILALAVSSVSVLLRLGPFAKATAFRQTAQGWEKLPPLGAGYDLRISAAGVAWVETAKGLNRLEAGHWHLFTASDFGTQRSYLPGGFALDGEDVWAAASDSVVHFDGKRWQRYPNAIVTHQATSIAAAGGQVWAIDREGNLSHFDGVAWTVRQLDLPGVIWNVSTTRVPKLALTGNGVLWLEFLGLWRWDGASWTRVSGPSSRAELLGVDPPGMLIGGGKSVAPRGGVWVFDHRELLGINVDGLTVARYKMRDLGLLESTRVYRVVRVGRVFAVTSSQGLVWWNEHQWHGDQLKSLGIVTASSIAVSPDGSLWGIGYPSPPLNSIPFRYKAVGTLVLILFALGYPIWWWRSRKAQYRGQAMREALLHATGAIPEDLAEPSAWKSAGAIVVVLGLGVGSYWLLKHYWRAAPPWLLPMFVWALHSIAAVAAPLMRKPKPSDPIAPGGRPRYDWATYLPAILGWLAVLILFDLDRIALHFHIWWLASIPRFAPVIGGSALYIGYDWFRFSFAGREIKRCRYGRALAILDGPLRWPSTGSWKLLRVEALLLSGRARDAEPILREMLETKSTRTHQALIFEQLGRVLTAQNRYEDAKRAFAAAAMAMPGRSPAYSGLAELRLLQGVEPVQALADAERALQLFRSSLLERKASKERIAIIRGNQAWALARVGRSAESHQVIEAGLREMDMKYTPEAAGFYWRAGMAMLAIDNANAAAGHFRRAVELDSEGYYGRLAAQDLRTLVQTHPKLQQQFVFIGTAH